MRGLMACVPYPEDLLDENERTAGTGWVRHRESLAERMWLEKRSVSLKRAGVTREDEEVLHANSQTETDRYLGMIHAKEKQELPPTFLS